MSEAAPRRVSPTTPRLHLYPFTHSSQMAGGKKKKKPASNPARGFATTSIASKPKVEAPDDEAAIPPEELPGTLETQPRATMATVCSVTVAPTPPEKTLIPEEFEKQLENSELQVLVEKHAHKSKRDALRQKTRLETDRRVLRGQAENLNTRKWLPPELMEQILDLIKAEGRFSTQAADNLSVLKQVSEEELTIRLWTLHQSLVEAGFIEENVVLALQHVLVISDKIRTINKDSIWGMEEALDWFARECSREELPDYDNWQRKTGSLSKSQTGSFCYEDLVDVLLIHSTLETPTDSPLPSGTTTPRLEPDTRHVVVSGSNGANSSQAEKKRSPVKKLTAVDYDSDIDPDDLLPVYLECKEKLFLQESNAKKPSRFNGQTITQKQCNRMPTADPESAKILKKIKRIEDDVLFDRHLADQKWDVRRIQLERDAASRRNAAELEQDNITSNTLVDSDDDVCREAAKIGAALLEENESDDDAALADLFASLPVNEVDPLTGKSSTVVNERNGVKVTIRDFGKWTGVNPTRVVEEACRAR